MTLADSQKLIKMAIAKETTPGTAETTPDSYVYLTNTPQIKVNRNFEMLKPASHRDVVLSTANGYTTSLTAEVWGMPVSVIGHMMAGAFGSCSAAQQGGTIAYKHTFSLADTLNSYTIWHKTGISETKSTYNQVNKLTINSPQNKVVNFSADFVGGRVVTTTDFGAASYSSVNPFKSQMGSLTFGQAGATVRTNMTDFQMVIDNGINIDEGIVHGQRYPNTVIAGDRKVTGSLTFWMPDNDEGQRFWEGVDTDPSATEPAETPGLVTLTSVKWTGPTISGAYNYELEFAMDNMQLTAFDYEFGGNRIAGKAEFQAVVGTGSNLLLGYLTNTRTTAY